MIYYIRIILLFFYIVFSSDVFSMDKIQDVSIRKIIPLPKVLNVAFLKNNKLLLYKPKKIQDKNTFAYIIDIVTDEKINLTKHFKFLKDYCNLTIDKDKSNIMFDFTINTPGYQSKRYHIIYDILQSSKCFLLRNLPQEHCLPMHDFAYSPHTLLLHVSKTKIVSLDYANQTISQEESLTSFLTNNPYLYIIKYLPKGKVLLNNTNYSKFGKGYYIYDLRKKTYFFIALPSTVLMLPDDVEYSSDGSFVVINNHSYLSRFCEAPLYKKNEDEMCHCNDIYILNIKSKNIIKLDTYKDEPCLGKHRGRYAVAIHPNNKIIALLNDTIINYFCAQTGKKYDYSHKGPISTEYEVITKGISFSADGELLAAIFSEQCIVYNVPFEIRYGIGTKRRLISTFILLQNYTLNDVQLPREIGWLFIQKIIQVIHKQETK